MLTDFNAVRNSVISQNGENNSELLAFFGLCKKYKCLDSFEFISTGQVDNDQTAYAFFMLPLGDYEILNKRNMLTSIEYQYLERMQTSIDFCLTRSVDNLSESFLSFINRLNGEVAIAIPQLEKCQKAIPFALKA